MIMNFLPFQDTPQNHVREFGVPAERGADAVGGVRHVPDQGPRSAEGVRALRPRRRVQAHRHRRRLQGPCVAVGRVR